MTYDLDVVRIDLVSMSVVKVEVRVDHVSDGLISDRPKLFDKGRGSDR
jgi:hypothetical protein